MDQVAVRDLLLSLSPDRLRVLAAYVYDGSTQAEIAADEGMKQTTVSHWIRSAVAKLAAAGVRLPGPRRSLDPVYLDPVALDRLTSDGDGTPCRWEERAAA
ncbi:MAG: hypothetical protein JWO31_2009 [Phycisphaerales bacterium]|nr:hypothetical protein [Phycisphaerales bacterium]